MGLVVLSPAPGKYLVPGLYSKNPVGMGFAFFIVWVVPQVFGQPGQLKRETLKLSGLERSYHIYIPKSAKRGKKNPAVVAYHGLDSDGKGMRWLIGADQYAEKFGFVMIYPNSIGKTWQVGTGLKKVKKRVDDVSFASAILDVVKSRHPVDPNRVFVMGFSDGAQMVAQSLCRLSHKIAAAAMVSHTLNIAECEPKYRVPLAIIHGAKDAVVPFIGGGRYGVRSFAETVDFFRKWYGNQAQPKTIFDRPTVHCKSYGEGALRIVSCVCFNDGHNWPGGKDLKIKILGSRNRELNATEWLFQFFSEAKSLTKGNPIDLETARKLQVTPNAQSKKGAVTGVKENKTDKTKPVKGMVGPQLIFKKVALGKKTLNYWMVRPALAANGGVEGVVLVLGPGGMEPESLASLVQADHYSLLYRWLFVFIKEDWTKRSSYPREVYEIYRQVRSQQPVLTDNTYVLGFSAGGRAAQRLYCEQSHWISAVAICGYTWAEGACEPVSLVPLMRVQSKKDPLYPFGGDASRKLVSFKKSSQQLERHLDGLTHRERLAGGKNYRCNSLSGVSSRWELVSCTTEWGGNTFPGSKFSYPKKHGPVMMDFDSIKMMMAFFSRHPHHDFGIHQRR